MTKVYDRTGLVLECQTMNLVQKYTFIKQVFF